MSNNLNASFRRGNVRLIDADAFQKWMLDHQKGASENEKYDQGDNIDREMYYSAQSLIDVINFQAPTIVDVVDKRDLQRLFIEYYCMMRSEWSGDPWEYTSCRFTKIANEYGFTRENFTNGVDLSDFEDYVDCGFLPSK